MAYEIAAALRAPLDVFVVRKLGVPRWRELAMGAVAGGGGVVLNDDLIRDLGITTEQQTKLFGHLLKAFTFGAPPHGGIALGVDRLVMLITGTSNIREVIAFPKNSRGFDLMMDAPSEVPEKQLRELHIQNRKSQ